MKSRLVRELSEVEDFDRPKVELEQYVTPPALAADMVFTAYMNGDIEGRKVVDLGCGTGILSIGAALLEAEEVVGVEKDADALELAEKNFDSMGLEVELVEEDVRDFEGVFDTVLMNPPFSVHSELFRDFLEKAMDAGDVVYTLAPEGSLEDIKDLAGTRNYTVRDAGEFTVSLPPTYGFHSEEEEEIGVLLCVIGEE